MGVCNSANEKVACMFDSVTGLAFGPTFDSDGELDDFLEWANENEPRDLRILSAVDLNTLVMQWRAVRATSDA